MSRKNVVSVPMGKINKAETRVQTNDSIKGKRSGQKRVDNPRNTHAAARIGALKIPLGRGATAKTGISNPRAKAEIVIVAHIIEATESAVRTGAVLVIGPMLVGTDLSTCGKRVCWISVGFSNLGSHSKPRLSVLEAMLVAAPATANAAMGGAHLNFEAGYDTRRRLLDFGRRVCVLGCRVVGLGVSVIDLSVFVGVI